MIWDVSKCINITRVQSPKQTFHTLKIIFCFLLFCTVHFSFVLCPLSISLPPSAPLFLSFIPTSVTLLRREPLSDLLAPPKNTKKIMPAELSLCWEKEGRRTQGERERREETRRKERTGGRKGGEGGREREKRDRGSGCSCSCGPGGELPSPGCSAETSMGGCVGSHHDSSGSLNENSDGTGGNLRGLSTSFIGHKLAFLFFLFFYEGLPPGSLHVVLTGGLLPFLLISEPDRAEDRQQSCRVSPSMHLALKRQTTPRLLSTLQSGKHWLCQSASLCSLVLTKLAG